jgi:hypothetical protein
MFRLATLVGFWRLRPSFAKLLSRTFRPASLSPSRKQARRHPFVALLRDLMDDGKVVVHLGRAENRTGREHGSLRLYKNDWAIDCEHPGRDRLSL